MAEYIERESVYRAFSTDDTLNGYEKAYCKEIIRKIPSADVYTVKSQHYSNRRWLNGLSNREFAKHLINSSTIPDYDYDYDDNLVECGEIYVYTTTDGTIFYSYEEALDYETRWLWQERPDQDDDEEEDE